MPLLGNVVISKKILRTRKIMVIHSNERGECSPRTLVDHKWKRYDNAVDVVVRLHDPTDPSTEHTAPPCSAHVQLDDFPRTLDPVEAEGEFRPRTLVDHKWKRYENAVDAVVHLHDPTDLSTERTAPPSSAHVQLDDDPRTPIK